MDALEFLESVAGYTEARNRPTPQVKLGTVDAAYDPDTYPATLPKITFDGESTLSGKRYPVIGSYWPHPSDRVVLLPTGTTYAILGSVDQDASARVGDTLTAATVTATTITVDDYTDASLDNGWAAWGSGFATPGYLKTPDGVVRLRGLAAGGSKTSDVMFTLPSGSRPGAQRLFAVGASDALGLVTVATTGTVSRYVGTATWVSLDGVSFVAGT